MATSGAWQTDRWADFFARLCPATMAQEARFPAARGEFQCNEHEGHMVSQLCVGLDRLESPEDFARLFLEPIGTELDRLLKVSAEP